MTRAIRQLFKEGADFIKLMATGGTTIGTRAEYASFSVREIAAAVETVHRVGKSIAAHCVGIPGMKNAIEAGVDHMEHASFLLPDGTQRFDPVLAEKMAQMGMYVTPTLRVYRDVIEALKRKEDAGMISLEEKKTLGEWNQMLDQSLACYKGLLDVGVKCVAGSDAGWGYTPFDRFWQELEMMVEGGMSPMQSIVAATKTAAEAMKLYHEIGSLEVGKQADILVVDGDPTVDVSALSKVSMIMKAGKICTCK